MASCDELNLDGRYKIKRVLSQTPEECFYEGGMSGLKKGSDTKTGQHVSAPSALPAITIRMPEYIDYSYQISENMYQCLLGKIPPDKQMRLLFDESYFGKPGKFTKI